MLFSSSEGLGLVPGAFPRHEAVEAVPPPRRSTFSTPPLSGASRRRPGCPSAAHPRWSTGFRLSHDAFCASLRRAIESSSVDHPALPDASAPAKSFTVQDDKVVTAAGRDSWGIVGRDVDVLNATWQAGQQGRSPCHVAAFVGIFAHEGGDAPSYVITDASGDHYAVAAKTLKSSLSKALSKTLRGAPKVAQQAITSPRKRAAGPA